MLKTWIPVRRRTDTRLGTFAGMTMLIVSSAFAAPHPFPVPFVERDHASQGITFVDLPAFGTIKIITITGEEVAKLDIPPPPAAKNWNVTNASGKPVATGIYFYLIESGSEKTTGKLVVIR